MARKLPVAPAIEPKTFASGEEIDHAITKLRRRIQEIEQIDFAAAVLNHSGADDIAQNNLRDTILEVYGANSPEYKAHKHLTLWAGPMFVNMSEPTIIKGKIEGRTQTIGIINGLIARLKERREDLESRGLV